MYSNTSKTSIFHFFLFFIFHNRIWFQQNDQMCSHFTGLCFNDLLWIILQKCVCSHPDIGHTKQGDHSQLQKQVMVQFDWNTAGTKACKHTVLHLSSHLNVGVFAWYTAETEPVFLVSHLYLFVQHKHYWCYFDSLIHF